MSTSVRTSPAGTGRLRTAIAGLEPGDRRSLVGMAVVILVLHVVGSACSSAWSCRRATSSAGSTPVFGAGVGLLAYTFGLRHAFDADHIAAVDNTTRKLIADRAVAGGGGARCRSASGSPSATRRSSSRWPSASPPASGAGRRGDRRRLAPARRHRDRRRLGLRALPLGARDPQPGRPRRPRPGLPADAARRVRRAGARGPARPARLHEPVPGRPDPDRHAAVAHLPGRCPLRARLRHRHRGRPARPGRRRGRLRAALLRDPRAARALRGRRCA